MLLTLFYMLLLAVAVLMPVLKWITIPIGLAVGLIFILNQRREQRSKIEIIQKRLSSLRGEGLFIEDSIKGGQGDFFYRVILTILTDLERVLFKLVEKNIQLLSLKEIGRSIISSMDEKKLIDSVFEYLLQGVGYNEAAFILLRKKKRCFQAVVSIEKSTRIIRRVLNFDLKDLAGAMLNSFTSGKAFLIKDVNMHPVPEVGGEEFFPQSTMTSYICVPLMKSSTESKCYNGDNCILRQMSKDGIGRREMYLSSNECLSCPEIPLLGALLVTDGYRAAPLTNIDQVTIETVGSLVGSNIENWMLYQELRQEEIFREKVFEGMMMGLLVTDMSGTITFTNRSAIEMSQISEDKILGRKIDELVVSEEGDSGESPVFRVLKEENPLSFHSAYLRRLDGLNIPIRMSVSQLIGDESDLQGAIVLFADMSDLKRMEEEIRHLDRLAVLGRFTSAIAHEIRNPLTGIAAGIQYLNRSQELSSEQRESISFILNEVDRLNRIITDLFKVAKPRDLLYQKVDFREIVDRSHKSIGELFQTKRIDFRTNIDGDLLPIEIDPDQITQVMINLLKNSVEAVSDGGVIEINARRYTGGDPDVVREKEREMVCIELSDDGPGIEKTDIDNVFEPFFSKKKGGTGLGLFVTQSIIQHHQGRISVVSEKDAGTVFRVYLPVSRPAKGGKVETGSPSG